MLFCLPQDYSILLHISNLSYLFLYSIFPVQHFLAFVPSIFCGVIFSFKVSFTPEYSPLPYIFIFRVSFKIRWISHPEYILFSVPFLSVSLLTQNFLVQNIYHNLISRPPFCYIFVPSLSAFTFVLDTLYFIYWVN